MKRISGSDSEVFFWKCPTLEEIECYGIYDVVLLWLLWCVYIYKSWLRMVQKAETGQIQKPYTKVG